MEITYSCNSVALLNNKKTHRIEGIRKTQNAKKFGLIKID